MTWCNGLQACSARRCYLPHVPHLPALPHPQDQQPQRIIVRFGSTIGFYACSARQCHLLLPRPSTPHCPTRRTNSLNFNLLALTGAPQEA